jgi:hypothetical protein
MRHGADELARGVARQLGVGVQGDDVAHVASTAVSPTISEKPSPIAAAQQRVQRASLPRLRS